MAGSRVILFVWYFSILRFYPAVNLRGWQLVPDFKFWGFIKRANTYFINLTAQILCGINNSGESRWEGGLGFGGLSLYIMFKP